MPRWLGTALWQRQRANSGSDQTRARDLAGQAFERLRGGQRYGYLTRRLPDGRRVKVLVAREAWGERVVARTGRGGVDRSAEVDYRYLWLPEGFVITPRHPAAPDGYGLPKMAADGSLLNAPYGTVGGPLREVILNRYALNKYMNLDPEQPGSYWPLAYTVLGGDQAEFDLPGAYLDGDALVLQFAQQFEPIDLWPSEEPGDTWIAHWSQEENFSDPILTEIFSLTNALRVSVGRTPVCRPLRGDANPARMVVVENLLSGYFGHANEGHREGYRTIQERAFKDGVPAGAGENLGMLAGMEDLDDEAKANEFYTGWRDSPGHYANMVATDWDRDDDEGRIGVLHLYQAAGTLVGEIDPVTHVLSDWTEPQEAEEAAQVFQGRRRWLHHGHLYWEGDAGRLSWDMAYLRPDTNPFSSYDWALGGNPELDANELGWVYLHGRRYSTPMQRRCFGAGLARGADGLVVLVVALLDRAGEVLEFRRVPVSHLERLTWAAGVPSDPEEWELYSSFPLGPYARLSLVRFDEAGERAVFRTERAGPEAPASLPLGGSTSWLETVDYPAECLPRRPMLATFWELDEEGEITAVEEVDGITVTVALAEHEFILTAAGTCAVAMDYLDGERISLIAEVNDYYRARRSTLHEPGGVGQIRDLRCTRELVFPSGKRVTYYDIDSSLYETNREALVLAVDFLDMRREHVAGTRLRWSAEKYFDSYFGSFLIRCVPAVIELFADDAVLAAREDDTGELFALANATAVLSGVQVDAWRPPHPNAYGPTYKAFLPYPYNGFQVYSGSDVIIDGRYCCVEEVCDYNQTIVGGGDGAILALHGGSGVYNPLPYFGALSDAWALEYDGELLAGAYNRAMTLTEFESGVGTLAEKTLKGWESDLDLADLTGLADLDDDIFPIGVI